MRRRCASAAATRTTATCRCQSTGPRPSLMTASAGCARWPRTCSGSRRRRSPHRERPLEDGRCGGRPCWPPGGRFRFRPVGVAERPRLGTTRSHGPSQVRAGLAHAGGRGGLQRHDAQEHRVRQEHPGRVLLPHPQAHGHGQADCQGEAPGQALRVRGRPHPRRLQERLLPGRGREQLRMQREVPDHDATEPARGGRGVRGRPQDGADAPPGAFHRRRPRVLRNEAAEEEDPETAPWQPPGMTPP